MVIIESHGPRVPASVQGAVWAQYGDGDQPLQPVLWMYTGCGTGRDRSWDSGGGGEADINKVNAFIIHYYTKR